MTQIELKSKLYDALHGLRVFFPEMPLRDALKLVDNMHSTFTTQNPTAKATVPEKPLEPALAPLLEETWDFGSDKVTIRYRQELGPPQEPHPKNMYWRAADSGRNARYDYKDIVGNPRFFRYHWPDNAPGIWIECRNPTEDTTN